MANNKDQSLATPQPPKPAGAATQPERPALPNGIRRETLTAQGSWTVQEAGAIRAYGDAREAAGRAVATERMLALVEALDAAMVESLMGEGADIWKGNRGKLRNRLPENVGAILAKMRALLAAAPAPEASKCGPACARCGSTTGAACSDHGCHYLTAGNGEPEAERANGDVYEAYKTWPDDIRAKLSVHDLRRMSGWAPRTHVGDWRIDTSAGRPILVYQNCSVIEAETATYVLGLIARDAPPPAGQPEGVEALASQVATTCDRDIDGVVSWTFEAHDLAEFARRLASAQRAGKDGA